MKILALDSSGLVASVAVLEDEAMIAEYTVNYKKTHSQTLLPMIDEIAKMINLDLATIDAIALMAGPGSFTGLRIGAATAKGLGLALDKPLVAVPTLAALAYNLYDTLSLVCPLMDARRNQVYTGVYYFAEGQMQTLKAQCAQDIEETIAYLNSVKRPVIFLGDGVPVYRDVINEKMEVDYSFAPAHLSRQRAGALGSLAKIYYAQGETISANDYRPDYLRLSQAERELAEKEKLNASSKGDDGR